MTTENNSGCATWLARLFGRTPKSSRSGEPTVEPADKPLPYRLRDDFLSPAELNFYRVLRQAIGDTAVICTKVSLGDLFYPKTGSRRANRVYRNKINRKHVDFLLCDPQSMRPMIGIELDDASHQQSSRQKRDHFVEQMFSAAGLPLLRQPVRASYNSREIVTKLAELSGLEFDRISQPQTSTEGSSGKAPSKQDVEQSSSNISLTDGEVPACPKCGKPMVLRTVKKKGLHYGKQFWGCDDFPHCRGVREYR